MVVWFNDCLNIEDATIELEGYNEELLRNFPSIKDMKTLINEAPIVEETIEAPTI